MNHTNRHSGSLLRRIGRRRALLATAPSFLSILVSAAALSAEPVSFARYPALSPDGTSLAFCYAGDVWVAPVEGGESLRLTAHPGYEHSPRWSPDGEWIAFSGARDGDDDLFVIPAGGGAARRLTFHSSDDRVCDWFPDGKALLFSARRDDRYPDHPILFRIPVEGGEPVAISDAAFSHARIAPNGTKLIAVRYEGQWERKGYRSSGVSHVWECDLESGRWTALTDTGSRRSATDFRLPPSRWPLYGGDGEIYLVSEQGGTANLWMQEPEGVWRQATNFIDDGVRFPSVARSGLIAFEQGLDVWTLKAGESPRKVPLICAFDPRDAEPFDQNFSDRADRVAFNPDGKQMFLEVRGEVIASRIVGDDEKAARGRAAALSESNPARDGDFIVAPGGDTLVVVSDRLGNRDLFIVTSKDPETRELSRALQYKWEPLVSSNAEEYSPQYSPDGAKLAFVRGAGNLIVLDPTTKQETTLVSGWSLNGFRWSPDSRWIAFAREDDEYNSDIFIIPAVGGSEINISRHPDEDNNPVWSGDGRKLAFRSRRRENNWDIYYVNLRLADEQKTAADIADEVRAKGAKDWNDGERLEDAKKKGEVKAGEVKVVSADKPEVVIDTTDIYKRIRPATNLPGEEGAIATSPDGSELAFTSNHEGSVDLYKIKWNGEDQKRLTNGGAAPKFFDYDAKGKRIRYLDNGGRVKSVDADGGSLKDHPFDCRILIDRRAERLQKLGEVWRRLNLEFYDPDFHGRNWPALLTKYRPWAEAAPSEGDFADVVNLMLGELNASHLGYNSPESGRKNTGGLGLEFDFNAAGSGYLVKRVLKNGPCDREASKILPGDRLLRVAGANPGEKGMSLERLLEDQVGQRVELIVLRGKEEKRFIVRPIPTNEIGELRYAEWTDARREFVDSLSEGEIGYLHIRGMGEESLARFEAELYSVGFGKKGILIDVRYNGGGWTTDWLLAILQVRRHATTYPRGGGPGYPQDRLPLYAWTKPAAALCNEYSFSNAEIFSHAMKTLQRGTLVGWPTPGGVISTGGDRLLDGSGFRIPLRGWYRGAQAERKQELNLEGNGAMPDLLVRLDPAAVKAQDDEQLRQAVIALREQLHSGEAR